MDIMNPLENAVASRLGGSTAWQNTMMPQMPNFGALPDAASIPQENVMAAQPAPQQEPQPDAIREKYMKMRESGMVDEDGRRKDGKLFRGPEAKRFADLKGGFPLVLKDKDLAAQLNRITINENRRLGGLNPLPEENADDAVNPTFQEHFQKKLAEKAAKFMEERENEIGIQNDIITNADAFESLMKKEGLKTGVGQEALDTTARWLERLGVDTSFLTGANRPATADALRQQVQTNVMNKLADQKGTQTEGDAARARETWVRIQNTPEGNLWINQYMKNIAQRKIDRNNFILDEMERNGGNVRKAQNAWQQKVKELPSVVPDVPQAPKKPKNEQPGRVEGTPGFNKPQKSANDESEWEDM